MKGEKVENFEMDEYGYIGFNIRELLLLLDVNLDVRQDVGTMLPPEDTPPQYAGLWPHWRTLIFFFQNIQCLIFVLGRSFCPIVLLNPVKASLILVLWPDK